MAASIKERKEERKKQTKCTNYGDFMSQLNKHCHVETFPLLDDWTKCIYISPPKHILQNEWKILHL